MATSGTTTINGSVVPTDPLDEFLGAVCNPTTYTYLTYDDLWSASGTPILTAIPSAQVTSLYDSTGITTSTKFMGYHWHNYPNTQTASIRRNTRGEIEDNAGLEGLTARSHDHSPNGNGSLRWHHIETSKGVFYWDNFDYWRDTHYALGRDLIFTLFGCPAWATGVGSGNSHYNNGPLPYSTSNPPTNMDDWSDYCTAVATRGLGKIKYYQVWNEANVGTSWFNGTKEQLAEMHRRAKVAITAVDPNAVMVACPMAGGLSASAQTYFNDLMGTSDGDGGYCRDHVDILSLHLYQNTATTDWKTWWTSYQTWRALLPAHGLDTKEVWYTEFGLSNPLIVDIDFASAKARLSRMLIQMAAAGINRCYLYSMDSESYGYLHNFRLNQMVPWLNQLRQDLMTGKITRVNLLWNGRIAYLNDGVRYLA